MIRGRRKAAFDQCSQEILAPSSTDALKLLVTESDAPFSREACLESDHALNPADGNWLGLLL